MERNKKLSSKFKDINITITPDRIIQDYNGHVKVFENNISLFNIRKQLLEIGFESTYNKSTKKWYKSEKIENHQIPYMVFVYYHLFTTNKKVPTLDEFISTYYDFFVDEVGGGMFKFKDEFESEPILFERCELDGRLSRAINSYHREIEFFYQIKEFGGTYIEYNLKKDLRGIDFECIADNTTYSLASFIGTSGSVRFKDTKNNKRHDYSNLKNIDLKAVFSGNDKNCINKNGIYLYSPEYAFSIYKKMTKLHAS